MIHMSKLMLILYVLLWPCSSALSWMMSNVLLASSTLQLNQADLALTRSVSAGAFAAIAECAYQFKYDFWSCPKQAFYLNEPKADDHQILPQWEGLVRPSTKETAFIHAITAAGIAHTLTKNCSTGDFPDCVCDTRLTRRNLGWEWGGCSDNFHFGSQVAKQFLDTVESGANSRSLANLHNNEAGRIAVRKTMRRLCKCHGVSGSCATQTCWKQISDFRNVGNYLKKMYNQALKVDFENGFLDKTDNLMSNRIGRKSRTGQGLLAARFGRRSDQLKKRKLVFLDDSPDYCRKNTTAGHPGVIGRTCSTETGNPKSHSNIKTCRKLCDQCGLKIRRKVVDELTSCNCRFQWCCTVTCETCRTKRIEVTCVP